MYSVVGSDGQVYGPVDMQTLGQWIAEGRVTPTTNLIDPLDGRVIPAGQAPALMGNFPNLPYASPPKSGSAMPVNAFSAYPRGDMMAYPGPPKSRLAAALLAFFLGWIGLHRFYLGYTGMGVGMIALFILGPCSCWSTWLVLGVWQLVDTILAATGSLREANGRALE